MPAKNNIRSIRFSDELAELIDRQQGSSFTQKFENLIIRCVWELPAKEDELKRMGDGFNRWGGLTVTFTAMSPKRRP